jgi:hypothetical protein
VHGTSCFEKLRWCIQNDILRLFTNALLVSSASSPCCVDASTVFPTRIAFGIAATFRVETFVKSDARPAFKSSDEARSAFENALKAQSFVATSAYSNAQEVSVGESFVRVTLRPLLDRNELGMQTLLNDLVSCLNRVAAVDFIPNATLGITSLEPFALSNDSEPGFPKLMIILIATVGGTIAFLIILCCACRVRSYRLQLPTQQPPTIQVDATNSEAKPKNRDTFSLSIGTFYMFKASFNAFMSHHHSNGRIETFNPLCPVNVQSPETSIPAVKPVPAHTPALKTQSSLCANPFFTIIVDDSNSDASLESSDSEFDTCAEPVHIPHDESDPDYLKTEETAGESDAPPADELFTKGKHVHRKSLDSSYDIRFQQSREQIIKQSAE